LSLIINQEGERRHLDGILLDDLDTLPVKAGQGTADENWRGKRWSNRAGNQWIGKNDRPKRDRTWFSLDIPG